MRAKSIFGEVAEAVEIGVGGFCSESGALFGRGEILVFPESHVVAGFDDERARGAALVVWIIDGGDDSIGPDIGGSVRQSVVGDGNG